MKRLFRPVAALLCLFPAMAFAQINIAFTGTTASSSSQITNVSTLGHLRRGEVISGSGIPSGATITSVGSTLAAGIGISAPATASATGVTLTAVEIGYTSVSASLIQDGSGAPLASGRVTFFPVNNLGQAISAIAGGSGGMITQTGVTFVVVNGAITTDTNGYSPQIADTALTTPAHICYRIVVTNAANAQIQGPGYALQQPTGAVFNLDTVVPNQPMQATVQTGPQGPAGPAAPSPNYRGTWSSSITYAVNDAVLYSGAEYISLLGTNLNQNPASATTYWAVFAPGGSGGTGATLPFPGVVYATSATGGSVATAQQITQPSFNAAQKYVASDSYIIGDSFQVATGSIVLSTGLYDQNQGWAQVSARTYGTISPNVANGGIPSEAINSAQSNIFPVPTSNSVYYLDTGFTNDTEEFTNSANWLKLGQRALEGSIFRLQIPDASKNFLQSASLTGTCALDGITYNANQGVNCASGGSITTSVTVGSTGVLEGCYQVAFGGSSTFTLNVNGTNQTDPISGSTTWITYGDGSQTIAGNATNFCAGFRIAGISPGSASVVITGAGYFNFQWLGSPSATSPTNPTVVILDVPQLATAVDPSNNTALWQTVATTVFAYSTADGQNLVDVPARSILGANPGSSGLWSGDNIHPSILGYAALAANAVTQGDALGISTNGPTLASGQNQQVYVPAMNNILKSYTLNPSNQQSNAVWAGLKLHFFHGGSLIFEGDAQMPIGFSSHTIALAGPNLYWAICDNAGTPTINYNLPPTSFQQCSMLAGGGGGINFMVPSSGQAGILLRYNNMDIDYYMRGFTVNAHGPWNFITNNSATSSTAYPSPLLNMGLGSAYNGTNAVSVGLQLLETPTNGTNQPTTAVFSVHDAVGYTGAQSVDWTGSVANGGVFNLPANTNLNSVAVCLASGTNCATTVLSGVTGSIGGSLLTGAGSCASGTATVTGVGSGSFPVGSPVSVAASDGSLPNGLVTLSAAATGANTVTVQVCAIAAVTPTAKTYSVAVF